MDTLLKGLGFDLEQRCIMIQQLLESKRSDSSISDYIDEIIDKIEQVQRDIQVFLRDSDFGHPKLISNQFFTFNRLAERVSEIEWYPLPAISRYNEIDRYLCSFCSTLAKQVGYPHQPPVVSGFSSVYYATIPFFRLIKIPAVEHLFLLGLPDMCHELGHIIFSNSAGTFQGNFFDEVSSHIQNEKHRKIREGAPPHYQLLYDSLEVEWKDHWTTEFICDMIATFLVGLAFGRTHLRLTSSLDSPNTFKPGFGESNTHPSAEARTRAIVTMLRTIGLDKDSKALHNYWLEYISATGASRPMEYELCYPDTLFDSLATKVNSGCVSLGLTSYRNQLPSKDHINMPTLFNDAWTMLLTDPKNYSDWETDKIAILREEMNKGA